MDGQNKMPGAALTSREGKHSSSHAPASAPPPAAAAAVAAAPLSSPVSNERSTSHVAATLTLKPLDNELAGVERGGDGDEVERSNSSESSPDSDEEQQRDGEHNEYPSRGQVTKLRHIREQLEEALRVENEQWNNALLEAAPAKKSASSPPTSHTMTIMHALSSLIKNWLYVLIGAAVAFLISHYFFPHAFDELPDASSLVFMSPADTATAGEAAELDDFASSVAAWLRATYHQLARRLVGPGESVDDFDYG